MLRPTAVLPLLAVLLLASACGPRGDAQDVDFATELASEFLRKLDANDAAGSWRELASPLRERVPEAQWPAQIAQMRAPLGRPVARELASAAYAEQLVDAPPGQYFMVEFESQFSEAACGERVVAMFEHGAWRVAGYFVRNTRPREASPR
jgi:Protein of unknown function (DUF4019)